MFFIVLAGTGISRGGILLRSVLCRELPLAWQIEIILHRRDRKGKHRSRRTVSAVRILLCLPVCSFWP